MDSLPEPYEVTSLYRLSEKEIIDGVIPYLCIEDISDKGDSYIAGLTLLIDGKLNYFIARDSGWEKIGSTEYSDIFIEGNFLRCHATMTINDWKTAEKQINKYKSELGYTPIQSVDGSVFDQEYRSCNHNYNFTPIELDWEEEFRVYHCMKCGDIKYIRDQNNRYSTDEIYRQNFHSVDGQMITTDNVVNPEIRTVCRTISFEAIAETEGGRFDLLYREGPPSYDDSEIALSYIDNELAGYMTWDFAENTPIIKQLYTRRNFRDEGVAKELLQWAIAKFNSSEIMVLEPNQNGKQLIQSIDQSTMFIESYTNSSMSTITGEAEDRRRNKKIPKFKFIKSHMDNDPVKVSGSALYNSKERAWDFTKRISK